MDGRWVVLQSSLYSTAAHANQVQTMDGSYLLQLINILHIFRLSTATKVTRKTVVKI